jgi:hypothetical protein
LDALIEVAAEVQDFLTGCGRCDAGRAPSREQIEIAVKPRGEGRYLGCHDQRAASVVLDVRWFVLLVPWK